MEHQPTAPVSPGMIDDATMLAIAGSVAKLFELAGIGVIVLGALGSAARFGYRSLSGGTGDEAGEDRVAAFRRMLGRAILTGLELLVAADIIRTVAIDPTPESVAVLGIIVLIRTFLSFSLEVEITGRWPWRKQPDAEENGGSQG